MRLTEDRYKTAQGSQLKMIGKKKEQFTAYYQISLFTYKESFFMLNIGGLCKPGFFGDLCESKCKCGNSLNENVCDKNGKCELCKPGYGGHFCTGK